MFLFNAASTQNSDLLLFIFLSNLYCDFFLSTTAAEMPPQKQLNVLKQIQGKKLCDKTLARNKSKQWFKSKCNYVLKIKGVRNSQVKIYLQVFLLLPCLWYTFCFVKIVYALNTALQAICLCDNARKRRCMLYCLALSIPKCQWTRQPQLLSENPCKAQQSLSVLQLIVL